MKTTTIKISTIITTVAVLAFGFATQTLAAVSASSEITSPEAGQVFVLGDVVALKANDEGAKEGDVQWAVRYETCDRNTGTVFGNVDGRSDTSEWKDGNFTAEMSTTGLKAGEYCFVFNPRQGDRLTQWFTLEEPKDEEDEIDALACKKDGWKEFGFRNQGQCVRYVKTGKDSR